MLPKAQGSGVLQSPRDNPLKSLAGRTWKWNPPSYNRFAPNFRYAKSTVGISAFDLCYSSMGAINRADGRLRCSHRVVARNARAMRQERKLGWA
jgi:hypothetical protein